MNRLKFKNKCWSSRIKQCNAKQMMSSNWRIIEWSFREQHHGKKSTDFLKLAKVAAILKKSDKSSLENYRSINSLCSMSKIFEKVLHFCMVRSLVKNKLFASEHFGFRKKFLRPNNQYCDWLHRRKIDKKTMGRACFPDLRKSFDALDLSKLLKKLYAYGYRRLIFEISSDFHKKGSNI